MKSKIFICLSGLMLSFSTLMIGQSLTINTPEANKTFCIGGSLLITWESPGLADSHVEIYLKNSAGSQNVEVIAEHTANDGTHTWTIPSYIAADYYRIGIRTVDSNQSANGPVFQIKPCVKKAEQKTLGPIKPAIPIKKVSPRLLFSKIDHGDVELFPARIIIRYGDRVCTLAQGSNQTIQVPEGSPQIDNNGQVTVKIKYTLKNKTSKNFKFHVTLVYNQKSIFTENVTLLNRQSKNVIKTVKLQSYSSAQSIKLRGPVGISDDTAIIFFNGQLWVRIFAL